MEKCSTKGAKKLTFVQVASGWPQTLSIADMKNFYKE